VYNVAPARVYGGLWLYCNLVLGYLLCLGACPADVCAGAAAARRVAVVLVPVLLSSWACSFVVLLALAWLRISHNEDIVRVQDMC
jgi:hypothetical protein